MTGPMTGRYVPARSSVDRLNEIVEAGRPVCAYCTVKAVLRLTYTTNHRRRTLWGETYVCADHADGEADRRRAGGAVREIKWL